MLAQLCGEKEVLAQIRMSFRNTQGYSMVVTRNLQLTVKKNTRVQKTLEAQLLLIKDGERTSLSSRVADLDQAMPNYLGVSRAVLDNVIFCHQDESLWPMSEPGVLKKKFDEIFEALKYTKAIENIKKLRKDKNLEMGRLKEKELKEKYIKDQGDKAEKRSRVLDAEIAELKAQMTELDTKAKEAEVEWREASNHAARYESDVHSLENKLKQQGWLKNNVDKLGKNLKQRNESDEWLQSEIDNYEVRMAGHREHEKQQKHQYISIMCNIKAARETLREKHSDIGRYEQQKADHQQHMKQRKIMIKESSQRHNIRGYDTDLDDVQINEYMERISRLSKDRDAAVDKARREADREAKKTRDLLSKLGEQRSALNEGKNSAKQQSAVNDRRIGTFQSDLNNIGIDESEKAILEDKATDIEVRLKKANDESKKALLESKINDGESQLRGLDQEKHQLNQELNRVVDQAGELASLDNYKKELTERKRSLDKTSAVNGDRLQVVVGKAWKPSSLETDFKKILDRNTDQVRGAERQRDSVSRVLEQVDYKLSGAKTDLQKAEKEATICVQRLKENIDGEPEKYLETLTEIQHARDHYKAEFDNFVNERTYFIKALKGAEEKHQCNLCSRAFQGDEEPKFISKMRKRIDKDISDAERDRNDTEEELRKAKEAGPSHDTWVRLSKTEVPRLQDVLKKLVTEREKVIRDIEGHDKSVNDRVEARDDVQSLANIVAKITKYHQEITGLSAKVDEHTAKKEDAGMSRNMDEIRSEMDMLSAKSHDLQNSIAKLRIEKDRSQSLISDLKVDLSKATSHLLTANHQLDKKANLWKDIEDLRKLNRDHRDCVQRLDEQTQELAPQIAEEDAKLNDIEERGFEKVKGLRQEASRLSDSVNKLYLAEQNIAAYDNDGGLAKLQKCQREIENVQQEIGKAEEEQNLVTKSIKKIQEELLNHEGTKRTIQNNIQYRESLRELETIKTEIAKLSVENAEADLSHWQKQTKHWSRLHNQYSMDYTGKLGESKVKDNQLADLIIQWNTEYKDAAHNFKKAHIEVEVSRGKHPSPPHRIELMTDH